MKEVNSVGAIKTEEQCKDGVCTLKVCAWSGEQWVLMGYGRDTLMLAQSAPWVSRQLNLMSVGSWARL